MFSCVFCKISDNTFLTEYLWRLLLLIYQKKCIVAGLPWWKGCFVFYFTVRVVLICCTENFNRWFLGKPAVAWAWLPQIRCTNIPFKKGKTALLLRQISPKISFYCVINFKTVTSLKKHIFISVFIISQDSLSPLRVLDNINESFKWDTTR